METKNKEIKLNHPISSYPKELIEKHFELLDGNSPFDNIKDLIDVLNELIVNNEMLEDCIKRSYSIVNDYLVFNIRLLEEAIEGNK